MLLLGFSGAFRRFELVALNVGDLEETYDGLRITIRHSKTDQEGAVVTIPVCRGSIACPVAAVLNCSAAAALRVVGRSRGDILLFMGLPGYTPGN